MAARGSPSSTKKFARRRGEILDVASAHINAFGVRGMTLTGVARALDLDTSSVTYYFKRKDDLAYACLERTLIWMRDSATAAAAAGDPAGVTRLFLQAHLDLYAADDAAAPRLAILSDMHSMAGNRRTALSALYAETANILRVVLGGGNPTHSLVSTLFLLSAVHWMPSWIGSYAVADFPRVAERMLDILLHGIGNAQDWPSGLPAPDRSTDDEAQNRFLLAATTLINRDGYHGASVEKIAAELGVSTGSFYHHHQTKDELVLACFERSFALIDQARAIGEGIVGDHGAQLAGTFASLLALQSEGPNPLLRSSAYQALPPELRQRMLHRTMQMTLHFCGKIADGIAETSLRAVDPLLAGHIFVSAMNAAADLRAWTNSASVRSENSGLFKVMQHGITGL